MASFLQYALSPFPRRRSRKSERDRASTASQDTGSTSSTPTPPSPAPKTRSVGIQTPVLQRRAFGPEDIPGTPTAFRRLKDKTRGWQASPLLSRRASQATLREGSATPTASRKLISPPSEALHSPTPSRRNISPPATSSCASLSSHEPPPTPSSCTSYNCESPPTPSSTRRTPSHYSVDSTNAHVVHVGAAGLGLGGLRGWEREVVLREACGRKTVVRESVRMSQCVVWECLPIPGPLRKRSHHKDENGGPDTQYSTIVRDPRISYIAEDVRGVSTVQLTKKDGLTLGLIVAGGVDKGHRPRVANLRPGSPAHRSDALSVGDYILAVNGIKTHALTHAQIVSLLKNAGEKVDLEVEYEIPNSPVQGSGCVLGRTVDVVLEKEEGSFGFTVRGGSSHDATKTRPLVITHVRPGGPADREGTIKAGDRLVTVDGRDLTRCSLTEAQETLRRIERSATLTVEYDVSVMENVRSSGGPLLVEIERAPGTSLGITLTHAHPDPNAIIIETIRTASIAERCGALCVNDIVAAIDGTRLDQLTVAEAAQLLKTASGSHITLEIIPTPASQPRMTFRRGGGVAFPHLYGIAGSSSGYMSGGGSGGYMSGGSSYNTLASQRPRSAAARRVNRRTRPNDRTETGSVSSHTTGGSVGGVGVCHQECLTVTLVVEGRGYGIVFRPPPHPSDPDTSLPVIAAIDPGGPADKCSVICVGDRLMGVNGRSVAGLGVSEVTQMVANSRPTVTLDVEFDVADSVVPSSGTFAVKLAKRHNGLGITLTAGRRGGSGEPLLISEVVRGSPAHRSGTMQPGDRLLAIDSTRLEHLTLEDARAILQCCDDIVTLRVQKDELYSEESGSLVVYTVELVRHGGALGITISGSEEPFDPIYIAGLAPGGLADRTGAIHIGDRLLAINGASLRGKPLSEAILMLQNSGDTVTLKISRPRDSGVPSEELTREDWMGRFGPAIPSVDSAVESWDSSGMDPPPPGSTPALSKRDSGSDIVFRSDCGSTVRRRAGVDGREEVSISNAGDADGVEGSTRTEEEVRDAWRSPSPPPSIDSGQSGTVIQRKKDVRAGSEAPMPDVGSAPEPSRTQTLSARRRPACPVTSASSNGSEPKEEGSYSISNAALTYTATYSRTASPPPGGGHVYQVNLMKDRVYEDFGFSVSDGLYEKGVYINRIRKGGPADRSGMLQPYDRILQVNDTRTHDFDCCLTVPLMAAAGDRLVLVVSRNPHANPTLDFSSEIHSPTWHDIDEGEEDEAMGEKDELGDRELESYSSPTPSFTPIPTILKTL
ncbi:glutamate receptor-interacting protein 2-like isoform X4 [Penaeus chinensis]|uniref:glutamate receptor-interacting protein 2-like isoform X4 n=1 Tax=Penaeus chinensis TaxID=139456 RepID=UPI001FB5E31A|nr:glutamate receptor-interacting protein 2-like isoform X4 [Penaeus chinensis]